MAASNCRILVLAAALLTGISETTLAGPLSLVNGRFAVSASWSARDQRDVSATAVALTANTGYFTFFDPSNVELLVKVLDACQSPTPRFWIFAAGLTNVEVTLEVIDTWSGERRTFHSPGGQPFSPVQRTDLFATCSTPQPCGHGNVTDLAVSPRSDQQAEELAIFLDGSVAATSPTYDRVRADLAAMTGREPALLGYSFLPTYSTQSLVIGLSGDTVHSFDDAGWLCLNRWYGVTAIESSTAKYRVLRFRPRIDPALAAADYRELSGVASAEVDAFTPIGEWPRQDLCALRGGGDAIEYYFSGAGSPARQFRSLPGAEPFEEPFDPVSFGACAAFAAQ